MKNLNDKRNKLWTEIVDLISLKQLTLCMGDDFRTWYSKAEGVKRVSKSKKVHALADSLIAECTRIARDYTYFMGIPMEKTALVKTLIAAHVEAVQTYDHESVDEIEEYLHELKYAPNRQDLGIETKQEGA